jgi:hypothetical protein
MIMIGYTILPTPEKVRMYHNDRCGFEREKQLPLFSDLSKSEGLRGIYSLSAYGRSETKEGFIH